ncbi:pilus assembly protein [Aestuariicella sp. G3-2]|uniref:TadE/TadG family type IV pilus assembly protein n=1 Tax=Pseudomaricurvus albidus TaxID=2842452 RepID=UPI001C0C2075|nr:TadE/TadG family type IV pilus assembly protein [Aestuariicella albida]MBU3071488.1 pilus assembly protein [Aestuariicella albida]
MTILTKFSCAHNPVQQSRQGGLAMVEVTIVLPLLLLLLLAICEFGRVFYSYTTLNKTLQNGTRLLASTATPDSTGNIQFNTSGPNGNAFKAGNLIVYGNVNGSGSPLLESMSLDDVQFSSFTNPTIPTSYFIRVDVDYNYIPMIGAELNPFGYGSPIDLSFNLKSSVTMRVLE